MRNTQAGDLLFAQSKCERNMLISTAFLSLVKQTNGKSALGTRLR